MQIECKCGRYFLTEADPYVVLPKPSGEELNCGCYFKHKQVIFEGTSIIPLDDVQHIEPHYYIDDNERRINGQYRGIVIITKHTKWDSETDTWANNIYLGENEAKIFLKQWYKYKLEC